VHAVRSAHNGLEDGSSGRNLISSRLDALL